MTLRPVLPVFAALLGLLAGGCPNAVAPVAELRHYPIRSLEDVHTRSGVAFDADVTSDGDGALRIDAKRPTTVRLFETGDLDVEHARLVFQAKLRSQDLEGRAYLEMWCGFAGQGEFFSRALDAPLSGSVEWSSQETPFLLQKGQNPDNVKLNLVVDGSGTVWIDDVRLLRGAL